MFKIYKDNSYGEDNQRILIFDVDTKILHSYNNDQGILSLKNNYEWYAGSIDGDLSNDDSIIDILEHLITIINGDYTDGWGFNYKTNELSSYDQNSHEDKSRYTFYKDFDLNQTNEQTTNEQTTNEQTNTNNKEKPIFKYYGQLWNNLLVSSINEIEKKLGYLFSDSPTRKDIIDDIKWFSKKDSFTEEQIKIINKIFKSYLDHQKLMKKDIGKRRYVW